MKLLSALSILLLLILFSCNSYSETDSWNRFATSKLYENMKLAIETDNPFEFFYSTKEKSFGMVRTICGSICAKNATCLGFNFHARATHYVCEFFPENFCWKRQRIALKVWPGGTIWDKLSPGMTKACIDQQLANTTANYCEVAHPGCTNTTANPNTPASCGICARTCLGCTAIYSITNRIEFNCTIWPGNTTESPIFAFCYGTSIYLVKRAVNLSNGTVWPNYRMRLSDMHRISKINIYKTFRIELRAGTSTSLAKYVNFYIDLDGSLVNMTFISGNRGNALTIGSRPLKRAPWIEANSDCGSFWLLNSTYTSATMQCPGGDVGLFGKVNINSSPKQTGIRWPGGHTAGKLLDYVEIRLNYRR